MNPTLHDTPTGHFVKCLSENAVVSLRMLLQAVENSSQGLWNGNTRFYYVVYHTVIFADYYATSPISSFQAKLPYTITDPNELPKAAVDDVLPNTWYTKAEVADYILEITRKYQSLIEHGSIMESLAPWITPEEAGMHDLCPPHIVHYSRLEVVLYSMRHIQHHVGQLNAILASENLPAAEWI